MDLRHPFRFANNALASEILTVLAHADKSFTGRELERAIGHGGRGSYVRALRLLTDEGIVSTTAAGRSTLYRLNADHLAAPPAVAIATARLRLFERLREELSRWEIEPASALLFGSAARGDAGSRSDLDLLVVRPEDVDGDDERWRAQLVAVQERAAAWTGNDVRLLEYGEDEIADLPEDAVLTEAFSDGIHLAGAPPRTLRRRLRTAERE